VDFVDAYLGLLLITNLDALWHFFRFWRCPQTSRLTYLLELNTTLAQATRRRII